jgi:uncharacterized protein
MIYRFEWDQKKALKNLRKHNISFQRAAYIFKDANALSIFDEEHSIEEERWITLGLDNNGALLTVIHTFKMIHEEIRIRIISARKATKKEVKQYNKDIL